MRGTEMIPWVDCVWGFYVLFTYVCVGLGAWVGFLVWFVRLAMEQ